MSSSVKLNLQNINNVKITPNLTGKKYGRTFDVQFKDKSEKKIFNDLFLGAKKLFKKAKTVDELKDLKGYVSKLREAELGGISAYQKKDGMYKFRTWFHRLFGGAFFGSHISRVNKLDQAITKKLNRAGFKIPCQVLEDKFDLLKAVLPRNTLTVNEGDKSFKVWSENLNGKFFIKIQDSNHYQNGVNTSLLRLEMANGVVNSIDYESSNINAIPKEFDAILQAAIIEAYKASTIYKKTKNLIKIELIQETISLMPAWHLNELCNVLDSKLKLKLQTVFLHHTLKSTGIKDGGGLSRDYMDDVVKGIQNDQTLFVEVDGSIKLPRIINKDPSILDSVLKCSGEESMIYQNLGKLMGFCLTSSEKMRLLDDEGTLTTGRYFSDALFSGVLSLTAAEIHQDFTQLTYETHVKMAKALLQNWNLATISDIGQCLDLLDPHTLDTCLSNNDLNLLSKAVALAKDTVSDYTDVMMFPDIDAISKNRKQFQIQLHQGIFSNPDLIPNLNGTSLGALLAPLHQIAKGLHPWMGDLVVKPVDVSAKIQGSLDRLDILNHINYGTMFDIGLPNNPIVASKVQWLKDWIHNDATDAEVKQFLKFVTGASSLPCGKNIKVWEDLQPLPFPKAFTCGFLMQIDGKNPSNPQAFIESVKFAMVVSDYQMG